jgi:L-lactate utilization protein LutB
MNETFEQCRKNLLRRGFEVRIAATTEEARQILREEIRAAAPETISFGGSMTMEATGIVDELRRKGRYRLFDGVDYTLPPEERIEIRRQGLLADLYISGINAITEEGALYWLDGIGNRVAAIAFGPRKVLLVAGRNKKQKRNNWGRLREKFLLPFQWPCTNSKAMYTMWKTRYLPLPV